MEINKNEINNFINEILKDNTLNKINNIYLSNKKISLLNGYNIDYKNVVDIAELIFKVETFIDENYMDMDVSDLENLSLELSEFNYYYNTRK